MRVALAALVIVIVAALLAATVWLVPKLVGSGPALPTTPTKPVADPQRRAPGQAPSGPTVASPRLSAHDATVSRVTTLAWGDGPAHVGRRRDPESAHEGPMAIALGRDGSAWVLDQVNGRVLHRDAKGGYRPPFKVRETAQDLRADANGGVAVIDRLGAHTLQRFDADGHVVEERPLTSYGVAEPGGVTGLFDDASGSLYLEESLVGEGRRVVHAVGSDALLPGRPSRGGTQLLAARITSREAGAFEVRGIERDGTERFTTKLSVGRAIMSIVLLDSDRQGNVYAGVLHAMSAAPQQAPDRSDERLELYRLSPDGVLLARTSIAHAPSALESFRELAVGDDGTVTWMHPLPDDGGGALGETGMAIDRIAF